MPDRDVKTIKDQIMFQYAKIIACSSLHYKNGSEAKQKSYGFIKNKFKELQNNEIIWSSILREDVQFVDSDKKCVYCDCLENLSKEHIVPRSLNINDRCKTCDHIQGIHNIIWACKSCNSSKSDSGLYHFYKKIMPDNKKFYDFIPSLLEKKYLKTIYNCHVCNNTLDKQISDSGVLDLDFS